MLSAAQGHLKMNFKDLFEPSLGAYLTYCLNFSLRYFLVAGGVFWLLRRKWIVYRIQEAFPSTRDVAYEIRWSLLNASCTGMSTILLYGLIRDGRTRMYFEIAEYGWLYLVVSGVLIVVGYDAWFYWYHRLLHRPWFFERVHAIHHRTSNPSAFAAYALHPFETFLGNSFFVLFPLVVPVHPLAFGATGFAISIYAFVLHSGFEFFPRSFSRHFLLRWISTSTHHNMHHRDSEGNFGALLMVWDKLMDTHDPAYLEVFDTVKARGDRAAATAAVAVHS
ncbi:MAG TPA: sterol desaturase family protein [Terriglobales bacterium]|nr:sterol desaturase family protein [Terriglobales bacterium]